MQLEKCLILQVPINQELKDGNKISQQLKVLMLVEMQDKVVQPVVLKTNAVQDKELTHKVTAFSVMIISPRVQMECHALSQTVHTMKSLCLTVLALHAQCSMSLMRPRPNVNSQIAQMVGRLAKMESARNAHHT
jgi:hypothetical protein